METHAEQQRSYLFLVRLWPGEDADGHAAWCGKLQHVVSGEAHRFQDWPALIDLLCAILPDFPSRPGGVGIDRVASADTADDGLAFE